MKLMEQKFQQMIGPTLGAMDARGIDDLRTIFFAGAFAALYEFRNAASVMIELEEHLGIRKPSLLSLPTTTQGIH